MRELQHRSAYCTVSHFSRNEGKNRSVDAEMLLISQSVSYLLVLKRYRMQKANDAETV